MALIDCVQNVEQQKVELEEASRQQEVMEKELNDSRILLGDIQYQLKDVRTRSQVMEDDLLKSVRAVETLKSEMPPQIIEDYKKSPEFNMGLQWTGQVSYEYEYQVALARHQAW
ncbi:hypothetical protein BHM03_00035734 [Ensete ventricosum]|nr:hypothetical protein BHM03_00035734 [Ensete ventricosum]